MAAAGGVSDGGGEAAWLSLPRSVFRSLRRDAAGAVPRDAPVVLFPEGAIRVEGTGRIILELCDGHFTLAEIVRKLEEQFMLAPKGKIRADVLTFLEQLHAKRVIDY